MARWFLPFSAIDPRNFSCCWPVGISKKLYKIHQNKGNEKQIARIVLVDEILRPENTIRIYKGWARFGKEDSFVYQGQPSRDYKSLAIETPPPPKMVFLVFILPDGTIDEWTWRSLRPDKENQVNGLAEENLIWSKNLTC